jgi:WD40 repeat protein/serine/threonine protein kinase/TPR repeat protein
LTPDQWQQIKTIFQRALALAPQDRPAFLDAQDPALRGHVQPLLRAYERDSGFLDTPPLGEAPPATAGGDALIGKQFGPYRVLSLLGEGGMGSVWLAERIDGLFARQVALKLVHPALMGRGMYERLSREREILASLDHPNIARLFDAGFSSDGQPYLALAYVAGIPLTTYCDEHCLAIDDRLLLFQQVLAAVQYAHAHLVIHRDLKPSNILVTGDGQVRLLDFGIAKLLTGPEAKETELTRAWGRALTPDYASPEQILGKPVTIAADVYALGVMLYELLSGERPYRLKRDSRGALEEAILRTDPVAPSRAALRDEAAQARKTTQRRLSNILRGDLDTIVIKALKKEPAERYATADAFGEDLVRFLNGRPVLAQRDRLAYRAVKFARRNWIALSAAAVLIVSLAGGLAGTSYEAKIAAAQRDAALQERSRALTQSAAARLKDGDVAGAMGIILEVLRYRGTNGLYMPEALNVFQEARAASAEVLAITGHTDRTRWASFSPDGQRIVTASFDKTARVWDAATGRPLLLLAGHTDRVMSAAFSADGRWIVTASYDKTARIWDAATGRQVLLLAGHASRVYCAVFSPDGQRIVTASMDKTARIWDAATGRQVLLLAGHTDSVISAMFSPDGRQIVTASNDKSARTWDASTGRQVLVLTGHTDAVTSAAFSPDGQRIVTASYDETARVWDSTTGRQVLPLVGHTNFLYSAAFSPDGQQVVTASTDESARIWDAATGRQMLLLAGHTGWVESAAFSPDGQQIVTASIDKTVRIWDAATGREVRLLAGHTEPVDSAAFSPDGRQIVTASDDNTARIWDTATGQPVRLLAGHTDRLSSAAFSPDGRHIVTASIDKTVRIWDAATGREERRLAGHTDWVSAAAFSPDGQQIVTASWDKTARIWDAATGRQIRLLTGHTDRLESVAFSPDGRQIVTASDDQTARIWEAATGRQTALLAGHGSVVICARFSPDGRAIVTASDDKSARIWEAGTGRELLLFAGHAGPVYYAAFSPDGTLIVTASTDKSARIWEAATGQQVWLLAGHTNRVQSAVFSPDGQLIVTASNDKTARIWAARFPALDTQIEWAEAAQFDSLSSAERVRIGLQVPSEVRRWPVDQSKCDESAAAPYDPGRRAPGLLPEQIVIDIAVEACTSEARTRNLPQSHYQHARALMAGGQFLEARRELETAIAGRYSVAQVDLAMLLTQPTASMLDPPRAVSLYEHAWTEGVRIAAFELGGLYEHGVRTAGNDREYSLPPDQVRAWRWYQKGADAGEPNALARFAENADATVFAGADTAKKNQLLLGAFRYYAAAAERARLEDWPDSAWRDWRYRRASIARLLAREGMMEDVAREYAGVRQRYAPQPTAWQRAATIVAN